MRLHDIETSTLYFLNLNYSLILYILLQMQYYQRERRWLAIYSSEERHERIGVVLLTVLCSVSGPELLKRKFNSSQDLSDFPPHILGEDSSHRSFQVSNPGEAPFGSSRDLYLRPQSEFDDGLLNPEPPKQSAFLDVFRNNPDRRPSNAGFLRRPSAVNLRRPSTVVEHKLVPSTLDRRPEYAPNQRVYQYQHQQQYQHQHQQQPSHFQFQQIVDDHFRHYYEPPATSEAPRKKPGIDLTELSILYGIPLSPPRMEDEEGTPYLPHRRSTMPTVLDPNLLQTEGEGTHTIVPYQSYNQKH